jgi:hypothetical protein
VIAATAIACALGFATATAHAATIDFDSFPVGGSGFYNGSDLAGDFASGKGTFTNNFTDFGGGCCWDGWAVSNHGDIATPGFGNQYSSYAGGGVGGGGNFGVGYTDTADITLASAQDVTGVYLANTTYAALSMLNGDGFAKQFGGASGTDADWFNVTIEGKLGGASTGSVVFYLADYRFADSQDDYIVDAWTWVDLTSLGTVDELDLTFGSSDVGGFGINTPTYVAFDSLTSVPEPGTGALLACGLALMGARRRSARAPQGVAKAP